MFYSTFTAFTSQMFTNTPQYKDTRTQRLLQMLNRVFKFHSPLSLYSPVTTTLLVAFLTDSGELTMD